MTEGKHRRFEFGEFVVDADEHLLLRDGQPISLTPKAFETLVVLLQNRGHLVEKKELLEQVWPETFVAEGVLARNISVLRRALGESAAKPRFLQTVPKLGYRFSDQSQEASATAPEREPKRPAGVGGSEESHNTNKSFFAAVYCDLDRDRARWQELHRDGEVAFLSDYLYRVQTMASQYGALSQNYTGGGHLLLFEGADAAVRFGLRLLEDWRRPPRASAALGGAGLPQLRLGCTFGECIRPAGGGWIGREIDLAQEVAQAAAFGALFATEPILDLIDTPLYDFREAGGHRLAGDHLSQRTLYRLEAFHEVLISERRAEELTAGDWFLRAVELIGTRDENSDDEERCYREALARRPDYAEAHNNLGVLLRARGDLAGASKHYRAALRLRPDYPEAHYNYAILLEGGGRTAGASQHYLAALEARPVYVDAHQAYANLLKAKGDLTGAERHYREALGLRPRAAELHNNYALLLREMGRPEEAGGHFETALELRPEYPEALYNFALHLESRGQTEAAKRSYRRAIELRPHYPEAHNNLAVLLHTGGELGEAETHYAEALRQRPDDPEGHYNYSLLLHATARQAEAQEHLRLALELSPDEATFQSMIEPSTRKS